MSIALEAHVGGARLDGTRGVLGRIAEHHLVRVRVRVRASLVRTPTPASHHPNHHPHPHPNYHPNHHPSRHLGVADQEERERQRRERGRGSEDGREARVRRVAAANVACGALDTRRHLGRHLRLQPRLPYGVAGRAHRITGRARRVADCSHRITGRACGVAGWITWGRRPDHVGLQAAPRRRLRRPGRRA